MSNKDGKILILPGDGIGPEINNALLRLINCVNENTFYNLDIEEGLIGGASYDIFEIPITDQVLEKANNADAVILGAVGGPKYDNLPFKLKPERGLLKLRKELDLFANIRPAKAFNALKEASSLKSEIIKGMDIIVLRELTGGIYFGEPRGIEDLDDGQRRGVNTEVYTTNEIVRLAKVGFEIATERKGLVHSVEKANVMESGILWREEVKKLHETKFSNITLLNMYADNCAMQLVKNPSQFDVIITGNLFGDILSDISAELTGSLGMLPSASLGDRIDDRRKSLYEPVHGSAPDIAGKNIANPIAMIMSFSMMLEHSFYDQKTSKVIEKSVENVLENGFRTKDICQDDTKEVSTSDMGELICEEFKSLSKNI